MDEDGTYIENRLRADTPSGPFAACLRRLSHLTDVGRFKGKG